MNDAQRGDPTRLRQALLAEDPQPASGGCPDTDDLWASAAGELDPAADEGIILHLARCSECSSIWRLAREMLPADHPSKSSVTPIGDRNRLRRWQRVLLPAAAAAALIGVGLTTGVLLRNDPSSPPVYREQQGADGIAASPETSSLPRTACRLRWSAGPEGARYDLTVTDDRLEILDTVKRLTRPEYTLAPEAIPASTQELFWRVTAHLPDGRTMASPTFTTTIEDPESESDTNR